MAEMTALSPKQKVDTIRGLLEKLKPEMGLALPKHLTPDRMARIALTSCLRQPKLLDADPASFAGAILTAAQIGLEPDGREAHLVPFWNSTRKLAEVQLIPDYKGFIKLARQSGQIKTIDFREVRAGDRFEYKYGTGAFLTHVPSDEAIHTKGKGGKWGERDITHCYAIAVLSSGESVFEVMRWEDVEYHRDTYSRAAGNGPWISNPAEMGAKTCVRKLYKKLPTSNTPMMRVVDLDERAAQGIPQDLGALISLPAATEAPARAEGKLDKLTQALKSGNGADAPPETAPPAEEPATEPSDQGGGVQEDPKAELIASLRAEIAKWPKRPTDDETWGLFSSFSGGTGQGDPEKLDVALLSDMLATFRDYTAKKASAVKLVKAALGWR